MVVLVVLFSALVSCGARAQTSPATSTSTHRHPHSIDPRVPVAVAGGGALVGSWLFNGLAGVFVCGAATGGVALVDCPPGWEGYRALAWVPLVGPWAQLADMPTHTTERDALLVTSGSLQAIGAVLLVIAAALPAPSRSHRHAVLVEAAVWPDSVALVLTGAL